jgi:hypothetical protein
MRARAEKLTALSEAETQEKARRRRAALAQSRQAGLDEREKAADFLARMLPADGAAVPVMDVWRLARRERIDLRLVNAAKTRAGVLTCWARPVEPWGSDDREFAAMMRRMLGDSAAKRAAS